MRSFAVTAFALATVAFGCSSSSPSSIGVSHPDAVTDTASDDAADGTIDSTMVDSGAGDAAADTVDSAIDFPWDTGKNDTADAGATQEEMCNAPSSNRLEWTPSRSTCFDNVLGADCLFTAATDGVLRCMPATVTPIVGYAAGGCGSPHGDIYVKMSVDGDHYVCVTNVDGIPGTGMYKWGGCEARKVMNVAAPASWYDANADCMARTAADFPTGLVETTGVPVDPSTLISYPRGL